MAVLCLSVFVFLKLSDVKTDTIKAFLWKLLLDWKYKN